MWFDCQAVWKPLHFCTRYEIFFCMSQHSSVSKVTGCRLDCWGLIPGRSTNLFATVFRLALQPTQPPVHWVLDLFPLE
jgi:hypothetical protein